MRRLLSNRNILMIVIEERRIVLNRWLLNGISIFTYFIILLISILRFIIVVISYVLYLLISIFHLLILNQISYFVQSCRVIILRNCWWFVHWYFSLDLLKLCHFYYPHRNLFNPYSRSLLINQKLSVHALYWLLILILLR